MSGIESDYSFAGQGYREKNVWLTSNFQPFYIAVAICSVVLGSILILNIICCCSRYSDYWLDRHTGNRWLISIWSATPHKQPPLDLTELGSNFESVQYVHQYHSEIYHEQEYPRTSISQQPLTSSQDYLEMQKRETVTAIALFVLVVIMLMLMFGARWCRLRHTTFIDSNDLKYENRTAYVESSGPRRDYFIDL